jgi:hypothetical protein
MLQQEVILWLSKEEFFWLTMLASLLLLALPQQITRFGRFRKIQYLSIAYQPTPLFRLR